MTTDPSPAEPTPIPKAEYDRIVDRLNLMNLGHPNVTSRDGVAAMGVLELATRRKVSIGDDIVYTVALLLADNRQRTDVLVTRIYELEQVVAEVERYARDREYHGRRDRTVGSARIASDLLSILNKR